MVQPMLCYVSTVVQLCFKHGSTMANSWLSHGSTSAAISHGHAAQGARCEAKAAAVHAHNSLLPRSDITSSAITSLTSNLLCECMLQ
jgi:hypothetical protein